jgi:protein-S-isoprenylcysteine O-methyltransferase Ste14
MTDMPRDNPGVIAPPPLIAGAALVLGLLADWFAPVSVIATVLSFTIRVLVGGLLILGGLALVIAAVSTFRAAGTHVEPWKPSLKLVRHGVYAWTRNPIYVGGMLLLVGIGVVVAGDWVVIFAMVSGLVLHFGVVLREERYLAGKFGEAYRQYMRDVPRYGWPA